jgi:hypothetical protein
MEGVNAKGKEEVMKQVNADGHVIGNHTFDHPLLTRLSSEQVLGEVQRTDDVLGPFLTGGMKMFRAPFGGWSPKISDSLNKTPLKDYVGSIFWDIGGDLTATHAADWACWGKKLSVEECGKRYLREIHDRGAGIVLMHDIHSKTIDMVKQIVLVLKEQGFTFVRIDQVPGVNAQLALAGAHPLPAVGALPDATHAHAFHVRGEPPASVSECGEDAIVCGSRVGRDDGTLYRCTGHRLFTACECTGACGDGGRGYGDACTCAPDESEPGLADAD